MSGTCRVSFDGGPQAAVDPTPQCHSPTATATTTDAGDADKTTTDTDSADRSMASNAYNIDLGVAGTGHKSSGHPPSAKNKGPENRPMTKTMLLMGIPVTTNAAPPTQPTMVEMVIKEGVAANYAHSVATPLSAHFAAQAPQQLLQGGNVFGKNESLNACVAINSRVPHHEGWQRPQDAVNTQVPAQYGYDPTLYGTSGPRSCSTHFLFYICGNIFCTSGNIAKPTICGNWCICNLFTMFATQHGEQVWVCLSFVCAASSSSRISCPRCTDARARCRPCGPISVARHGLSARCPKCLLVYQDQYEYAPYAPNGWRLSSALRAHAHADVRVSTHAPIYHARPPRPRSATTTTAVIRLSLQPEHGCPKLFTSQLGKPRCWVPKLFRSQRGIHPTSPEWSPCMLDMPEIVRQLQQTGTCLRPSATIRFPLMLDFRSPARSARTL